VGRLFGRSRRQRIDAVGEDSDERKAESGFFFMRDMEKKWVEEKPPRGCRGREGDTKEKENVFS